MRRREEYARFPRAMRPAIDRPCQPSGQIEVEPAEPAELLSHRPLHAQAAKCMTATRLKMCFLVWKAG